MRSRAIQAQLMSVSTFCELAESELKREAADDAQGALAKISRALVAIRRHLLEPGHVPAEDVDRLEEIYTNLAARAQRIEGGIAACKRGGAE